MCQLALSYVIFQVVINVGSLFRTATPTSLCRSVGVEYTGTAVTQLIINNGVDFFSWRATRRQPGHVAALGVFHAAQDGHPRARFLLEMMRHEVELRRYGETTEAV